MQTFRTLGIEISKFFSEESKKEILRQQTLLEKTIQVQVKKIERIERLSSSTIAIYFFIGDKMGCREFEATQHKIDYIISTALELNPEIRTWYP